MPVVFGFRIESIESQRLRRLPERIWSRSRHPPQRDGAKRSRSDPETVQPERNIDAAGFVETSVFPDQGTKSRLDKDFTSHGACVRGEPTLADLSDFEPAVIDRSPFVDAVSVSGFDSQLETLTSKACLASGIRACVQTKYGVRSGYGCVLVG